jgi:dephospho-CoA kinase
VGLSGGIASGKTTVSRLLQDAGIPLVDLDVLARQAVEPGTSALAAIASFFGPDVLHPDGTLNREALGSIVFHDEAKRKKLNGIVHPAVRRLMAKEVVRHWLTGQPLCVVDAPLLIEAGLWRYCGRIVLVYWSVARSFPPSS